MSDDAAAQHKGIVCDNCHRMDFMGLRYKCLICIDYDLCTTCHDKEIRSTEHLSTHPTQCILTSTLKELFFGGEKYVDDDHDDDDHDDELPQSFTCPHCGDTGFSLRTLMEHVSKRHLIASEEVLCPICVCNDDDVDGSMNEACGTTDNLALHLVLKHGTPRAHLQDVMMRLGTRTQKSSSSQQELSSACSSMSLARETPIEPMVRMMSQTLADMRLSLGRAHSIAGGSSPQEQSLHEQHAAAAAAAAADHHHHHHQHQTDSSDVGPALMARRHLELRRLAFRSSRSATNEAFFDGSLFRSICETLKGAAAAAQQQEPLNSFKRICSKSKRTSTTSLSITEITAADDTQDKEEFLLPKLQRPTLASTSEMKENLQELWNRAEFVQELLMSMLATKNFNEAMPQVLRKKESSKHGRRLRLQPCIQEAPEEDTLADTESTEL